MAIRARTPRPREIGWSLLLLVILLAVRHFSGVPGTPDTRPDTKPREESRARSVIPATPSASSAKQGLWEIYSGCRLVKHRNNDGDSFRVRLPDGREREYRLYFVDTPESQFKRYRDGNTNAERISEQARYFGKLSSEKAVAVGSEAKKFSLAVLADAPFDLITKNEAVFDSERHYAHVEVVRDGKRQRLDEMLVERGFARIHTKGEDLPDGTSAASHKEKLRSLEARAKQQKLGAWQ